MNNNIGLENLKDERATRREKKKRPRMRVHGRSLKKPNLRAVKHIAKIERRKNK